MSKEHNQSAENTKDQGDTGEFEEYSESPWVPGLVEVEFAAAAVSGLHDHDFSKPTERDKPSKRWSKELLHVISKNRILNWKPSFPLSYPWSRESREDALRFFKTSGRDKFVTFRFTDDADVSEIAARLEKVQEVVRASPVARLAPASIDEPLLGTSDSIAPFANGLENQWYAFRCHLPQALAQVTGKDVIIADIDWGFDRFHRDYSAHIALRKNIYEHNDSIGNGSLHPHGTAVLGLAGARDNDFGMVGFAPDSILWAIQAGDDVVNKYKHWVEAIEFVRLTPSPHRKVIILEIQTRLKGNVEAVLSINKAIVDAIAANIVVCVPAGNGTGDAAVSDTGKPIPETGSVLVGATKVDNIVCSKDGERVVVYAPGDKYHDLTCATGVGHTNGFGGTSGAVAKVAGAVALMLEADSSLTPAEVREILRSSDIPALKNANTRAGVVLDCERAVSQVRQRASGKVKYVTAT
jgi:subtilisin family serine protease